MAPQLLRQNEDPAPEIWSSGLRSPCSKRLYRLLGPDHVTMLSWSRGPPRYVHYIPDWSYWALTSNWQMRLGQLLHGSNKWKISLSWAELESLQELRSALESMKCNESLGAVVRWDTRDHRAGSEWRAGGHVACSCSVIGRAAGWAICPF